MEELLQNLLSAVEAHGGFGAAAVFLSSLIEYVFPPFPGDVVTLFATFLVVKGVFSFPFCLGLVMAGSLAGAALDYGIGRLIGRRLDRLPSEKDTQGFHPLTREKYEILSQKFNRYGAWIIAGNRFLPGVRAFFLVAAGAARMPFGRVMLFAALSAAAWNLLILGAGYAVGQNWQRLKEIFHSYALAIWVLVPVAALVFGIVWWRRRRRGRPQE